ncbi:MAG: hypothetical protein ACYC91_10220 [Solirubrobacteraceae bacterium]
MTKPRRLHDLLSALRGESGIAIPMALAVMSIALALSAAAVLAATNTNDLSNRDSNAKAALEAADAGVRAASYRLNMLLPKSGYCPTNPVTGVGTGGLCAADGPESLGNGATFSYWVSDVLSTGQSCAGVPITVSSSLNPQTIAQRCITAIGTANTGAGNQITARVQVRVASYTAQALFSVPGLVGLNELSIANNAVINASAGTNGALTVNNNAVVNAEVLGPNASQSISSNVTLGPETRLTPGQGPLGLPLPSFGNTATVNNDARIGTAGTTMVNCSTTPPTGYDHCSNLAWSDTATDPRDVNIANNGTLSLGGGTYNFCNFTAKNNVTITIPNGTYTTIYIDSPNDPNSGCAAGQGTFSLANNVTVTTLTTDPLNPGVPDPTALKIFVYGNPSSPGTNVVTWYNNSNTYGTLVAPFSSVELRNNGNWYGAVGGYNTDIDNNFTFAWYGKESSLYTGQQDLYYRAAWEQCSAIGFSASSPTAGC